MTKSKLLDIANGGRNGFCADNCKGCLKNNMHNRDCAYMGNECNGCTGKADGCKDPEARKEQHRKEVNHNEVLTISVYKATGGGYISKTRIDDNLSNKELSYILKEVLGMVL